MRGARGVEGEECVRECGVIVLDFPPFRVSDRVHARTQRGETGAAAAAATAGERERHERASERVRAAEARGDSLDGKAATTP